MGSSEAQEPRQIFSTRLPAAASGAMRTCTLLLLVRVEELLEPALAGVLVEVVELLAQPAVVDGRRGLAHQLVHVLVQVLGHEALLDALPDGFLRGIGRCGIELLALLTTAMLPVASASVAELTQVLDGVLLVVSWVARVVVLQHA